MHTLLVITHQSSLADGIDSALDAGTYRVITKEDAVSAGSLLGRGAVDAIILDVEHANGTATRAIEEVRALDPDCPLIVFAGHGPRTWEEDAYLLGVAHVLEKPVRARLLINLLDRAFSAAPQATSSAAATSASAAPASAPVSAYAPRRGLDELRHFSSLLVHSLNARELIRDAVQQLREALGVNRAAVFLRKASALPTDGAPSADDHWLRPAHTIGHDPALIEHFPLSLSTGLGKHLSQHGRILRSDSAEARGNREISREFHTLGSAIALPINDREVLVGALLLDERITGGTFSDEELANLFHWLEELGVAIRNCWRHEQLSATHGLIDDILAGLGNGCVVVGSNCGVLHANAAALHLLVPDRVSSKQIDFADIPQQIGSLIFQVIQSGKAGAPFKWTPPSHDEISCRVTILPFTVGDSHRPNAALLVIDDITEHERAAQLEMEAGKLRLVRQMAWHLAHEIGNAVTPVSTMQQLLEIQGDDAEVRRELSGVLASSVKRIMRLTQQMTFLSRDWDGKNGDSAKIADLIEGAYQDASSYQSSKNKVALNMDATKTPWKISGDTKALRHAFSELLLNALQANPDNPTITVRVAESPSSGRPGIAVEFQDTGTGFPQDVADKIGEPFQSTRSVGLGLGLTVSRKIIESHRGIIEIPHPDKSPGIVRVTLPLPEPGSN
jgi:signal transduction histidine kinase/DNA-binding NarL/FixJ family response regulator